MLECKPLQSCWGSFFLMSLVCAMFVILPSASVVAATGTHYVVDTLLDSVEVDGKLSLREALQAANSNAATNEAPAGSLVDHDLITFDQAALQNEAGAGSPLIITLNGSELVVTSELTVEGLGADVLAIDGDGVSRCFNLGTNSCVISDLTITKGYDIALGGGIYCAVVKDDTRYLSTNPVVANCIISNNLVEGEHLNYGGGMYSGTANDCVFVHNSATGGINNGGGMCDGVANSCTFRNNLSGGGLFDYAAEGTANNCMFIGNTGYGMNGTFSRHTANNCTFTGNTSGGIRGGTANNCIIWHNGGNNISDTTVRYSCSPDIEHGVDGCITNNPIMVSLSHIATNSPCRGAGASDYTTGKDIDGEEWLNPPSMGCDEYHGIGTVTGLIELSLVTEHANVCIGFSGTYTIGVEGDVVKSQLDFGDGHVATNVLFDVSHTWTSAGYHDVVLTAWNDDYPAGISVTQTVHVVSLEASAIFVSVNLGNDSSDGFNWDTAKRSIQAGVDAQIYYGGDVWVANGVYVVSERIEIDMPIQLQSINGAAVTRVDGGGSSGCFDLKGACLISGFSIVNGFSTSNGGGIRCEDTNSVISRCVVSGNRLGGWWASGGGVYKGTANNCTFYGNAGGGMYEGTANNCIFGGNTGGGIIYSTVNNCIAWGNSYEWGNDNIAESAVKYSCSPDVEHGVNGCVTNNPMMVSLSHVATNSPCRGIGSFDYAAGTDVDGEAWLNPPSMGADEYHGVGSVTGGIVFTLNGPTNICVGFEGDYTIDIQGSVFRTSFDFGDGNSATNVFNTSHTWSTVGDYDVVLTAWSDDYPASTSVTKRIRVRSVESSEIYVSVDTGSDSNDGSSWTTAKESIQGGIDAAYYGGNVFVTDGVYVVSSGISIDAPIQLRSVNGASVTTVDGGGVYRCFVLGHSCLVSGFTITNGYASSSGGGICCSDNTSVISNCVISGNSAISGGGMFNGVANNCHFVGNSANEGGGISGGDASYCVFRSNSAVFGGGMQYGTADNCIFIGNTASYSTGGGGGMAYGTVNNCTIIGNIGSGFSGWWDDSKREVNNCIIWNNSPNNFSTDDFSIWHSCVPDIEHGVNGCITNAPLFVDYAAGDYRLMSNSPCINWGNNSHAPSVKDMDDNPRIVDDFVDMGAYEYQSVLGLTDSDNDGILDAWEHQHFGGNVLPDGNADGDVHDNLAEFISGMDPTNSGSFFSVTDTEQLAGDGGNVVRWHSASGRVYGVYWTSELSNTFEPLATGIQYPQSSYTDGVHQAESTIFYKVKVELE